MLKVINKYYYVVLGALLFVATCWGLHYREQKIAAKFNSVEKFEPRSAIEDDIGEPDEEGPCGGSLWWGGDQLSPPANNGECVTWVRYSFLLESYAFGYSDAGLLMSKYHYVSE